MAANSDTKKSRAKKRVDLPPVKSTARRTRPSKRASKADSHPHEFLEVRVHELNIEPSLSGLCVGYEQGNWRADQFAEHAMEWLPEFALKTSEFQAMSGLRAVPFMKRAARRVYESGKFGNRGEFGELFLHIAIRQVFQSAPAISKIYYKSATNDTVKGFDAVHVVGPPDDLELWLGEAKFYRKINRAIGDVVKELSEHTDLDYLRGEFVLIADKIDDALPHSSQLRKLLSPSSSLDKVFKRACIPVLLTYDSQCLAEHRICDEDYKQAFADEINSLYDRFASKTLPDIRIHLFLLALNTKTRLIKALDKKLKTWQSL